MSEWKLYAFMVFIDFPFSYGVLKLIDEITNLPDVWRIVISTVLTVFVNVTLSRIYSRGGNK